MTVEEYAVDGVEGTTTYRFYIDMENPTFLECDVRNERRSYDVVDLRRILQRSMSWVSADGILTPFIAIFPSLDLTAG